MGQETQAMDIRPVETCPLVWCVQIWDLWFQPPCLCETQSRWTDDLHMCGSHCEAWRWWCNGALLVTVCDLFRIQGTLNQHGYHSSLQQYSIPSGLRLVGLLFVFQKDNDPKHTSRLCDGYLTKKKSDGSAASDDLASTITRPQPIWNDFDRRVKEKQPTSAQHMWELLQDCWKSITHEAGWENAKSVQSCHQGKERLLQRISNIFWFV